MKDWLVKMAEQELGDSDRLQQSLSELSPEQLRELATDEGVVDETPSLDNTHQSFLAADAMGRELAHTRGEELEKVAIVGALLAGAGRVVAGLGGRAAIAKSVGGAARDMAISKGMNSASNAFSKQPAAQQAMKYAFALTEEGHEFDADRYYMLARQAAERGQLSQSKSGLAAEGAPATLGGVFRFGGVQPGEVRPDATARHYEYAAKKHEQGRNAWNPFGGALTPSSHEHGGTTGILSRYGKSVPKVTKPKGKTKEAFLAEIPGYMIGKAKGKEQKERGEDYSFGGTQAASLLVPGGVGYQIGRHKAHKEKTANMLGNVMAAGGGKGGTFLSGAANMMKANPAKALAYGGAALGAANGLVSDPGVDQYGQPRSRIGAAARGAAVGGALGYGAGHLAPVGTRVQAAGGKLEGAMAAAGRAPAQLAGRPAAAAAATGVHPAAGPAAQPARAVVEQGGRIPVEYAQQVASDVEQSQQGWQGLINRAKGKRPINVPAEIQHPDLVKVAMQKQAFFHAIDSLGLDEKDTWIAQFEGTPLFEQAIQLEEQGLMMEMESIQRRQAESQKYQQEDTERQAQYAKQDQHRLNRRVLALELAKIQAGQSAPQPAAPDPAAQQAPPQAPPQQPGPAQAPEQAPPEAMPKMASYRFRR